VLKATAAPAVVALGAALVALLVGAAVADVVGLDETVLDETVLDPLLGEVAAAGPGPPSEAAPWPHAVSSTAPASVKRTTLRIRLVMIPFIRSPR
jgi:hypothetical protein